MFKEWITPRNYIYSMGLGSDAYASLGDDDGTVRGTGNMTLKIPMKYTLKIFI
jgi:hypothetical protein